MRETLIFGPAYQGGSAADPLSAVAALPPDAEICGCNGISKGTIVDAIEGGATDLGAVKATTKASASCGTCTGLVEQLLCRSRWAMTSRCRRHSRSAAAPITPMKTCAA